MNYQIGTTVFKDWKITRELGEGAYGKVFEIQKTNFGITTTSALKVLRVPRSQADIKAALAEGMDEQTVTSYFEDCVSRLVREIAIMTDLKSHPNIVGYEDHDVVSHAGEFGWDILIRMELLTSLQDFQRQHPLSEQDVIKLGRDLCSALSFCQKKGLIHRDIKPANIFVNEIGQFKLGDFGVSRTMEATVSNMSKAGTESYMAPEVYLGKPYGPSADLYSLGLVLFQLANNNRLPFLPPAPEPLRFSDRENALRRRLDGELIPTPLGAGMEFADVIRKACAHDPNHRYHTAAEMQEALEALGRPKTQTSSPTPSTEASQKKAPGRPNDTDRWSYDWSLEEITDDTPEDPIRSWEDEEKTEATFSVFGAKPPKAASPNVASSKAASPKAAPPRATSPKPDPIPREPKTPLQNRQTGPQKTGAQGPIVYFDRGPIGVNKDIAKKNSTPGQGEVWVTRTYMECIAAGTLPGAYMPVFLSNGIYWTFSGSTLKAYMEELQAASRKGLHTITVINRFPELGGLQETIYLHLQESKAGDIPIAQYDGVSSFILRLTASGKWCPNQNVKPSFMGDVANGAANNPFYGIRSFLYQPPKRVRITSALAKLGTSIVVSGYGEPKKTMEIPPLAPNIPSFLDSLKEDIYVGQPVNIAEFYRIEAIVPSSKLALWLPEEGTIYTAMMKSSAKEGRFNIVTSGQAKYQSLRKIFE